MWSFLTYQSVKRFSGILLYNKPQKPAILRGTNDQYQIRRPPVLLYLWQERKQKWTLRLYNAVNGSSHTDPGSIQMTTMDDVLYCRIILLGSWLKLCGIEPDLYLKTINCL